MSDKNFGPAVSGYLNTDGRSFETTVFQAGKPVLDKELNLAQDLDSGFALGLSRSIAPSGWLTDVPLNTSDGASTIFVASSVANTLLLANNLKALVNGWTILVSSTEATSVNQLTLPAGPAGNGAKRTDLVVLEVWRRLIGPATGDGKSPSGRIWRNGNVKIAAASDATLNYPDQLIDPVFNAETNKRVQIQYRLRVITGVDLFAYPAGIDDPLVVAHTVPISPASPDGTPTSFVYSNQSSNGDPGLWVAGDGIPSNDLGTVDGYIYAIPVCAVFRRNLSPFSKNLNHNGGVASPATSDRPDGLLSDIFVARDFADLRQATTLQGWDYQEVLEKNFGFLLDNITKTEWTTTPIGGGCAGHTVLWADEVGTLPGDGTITGDTPGAEFIGQFDCTRRFFTDRPNYEVLTIRIAPGDAGVSTPTWQAGTVVTIAPSLLCQYPYPATIDFLSRVPSGTRVIDVVRARIQGTLGVQRALDVGFSVTGSDDSVPVQVANIQGLGSYPMGNITITLGNFPIPATIEPIYIDLLVAYPPGQGLAKTPTRDFGSASFLINNPSALPATAPVSYASVASQVIDGTHRQIQLQYRTSTLTFATSSDSTTPLREFTLPERVSTLVQVRVNGVPDVGAVLSGTSGRVVRLTTEAASGVLLEVDYTALRPIPQSTLTGVPGPQFTVYYEARAPQAIRGNILGTTLSLIPRWISPSLYSITTGSGSQGEGYPYPTAYVQTGGVISNVGTFGGEYELDGSESISVADFNASTGFLKVPAYLPYVPNPEAVTFTRNPGDADIEGRSYFSSFPAGYVPNAYGTPLSDARVHKVVLPTLMELSADSTVGRKGTLLLVNFVRWASFDAENSIKVLDPIDNTTTASVFRIAGNLLNRRS